MLKVFLAPYVHTAQVERLAAFLLESGYSLLDYRPQAELVKLLWSKVDAQRLVFQPVDVLYRHRPKSTVAHSEMDLLGAISQFARQGITRIVVKSAAAVGGAGVFFLDSTSVRSGSLRQDFLLEIGQNEADRSAPFLIEERVQSDVSPTVDIEVTRIGRVKLVGVALQRLYDDRYYTGFYASPTLEKRWWFRRVRMLARVVGDRLADLGYVGPANVDFVVSSAARRITLIEVNPRRSALIDGFSLRQMKYGSVHNVSISVADYVNISERFRGIEDAFDASSKNANGLYVVPVADGGFSSSFRWAGVWAVGINSSDSEDILEDAVLQLQDPERDEIGVAERNSRSFERISENAA